jgi:hypothetical protein
MAVPFTVCQTIAGGKFYLYLNTGLQIPFPLIPASGIFLNSGNNQPTFVFEPHFLALWY